MRKNIPLDKVIPNPDQPRKHFDERALADLAASIEMRGLMQPIVVRPIDGGRYMIVGGERRWRAHKILAERGALGAKPVIACLVEKIDAHEMALQAIIENLQRADIKPLEEARAYQALLDRGYTVGALAKELGITQPHRITERTNLLKLDAGIQKLVDVGQFEVGHAYYLWDLPEKDQIEIVRLFSTGKIKGWDGVRAAAQAARERASQSEMFGGAGAKPGPSKEDREALDRMSKLVDRLIGAISSGWKDGECIAIKSADPNKADRLADQLKEIGKTVRSMETQLRGAAARAHLI